MGSMVRGRLYRLAKRLSLGRLLRYLDLWARYLWRRSQSRLGSSGRSAPGIGAEAQEAALAKADMATAKRMVVASWFPVDLAKARLHRAMLDHGEFRSVGEASQQEDIEGGVEGLRGLAVGDLLVDACREIAGAFQPRKAVACP